MLFDLTGYVLEKSRYFVKSSRELFYFTVCREKALRTLNCFTAQTLVNYPCSIILYYYTIIACNTFFKSLWRREESSHWVKFFLKSTKQAYNSFLAYGIMNLLKEQQQTLLAAKSTESANFY